MPRWSVELAKAERRCGSTLGDLERHDEAIAHFLAAEQILEKQVHDPDRRPELAETLHNHANSLRALGRAPEAIDRFQRAMALVESTGEQRSFRHHVAGNLARALWQAGRLDEAVAVAESVIGDPAASGFGLVAALHVRANVAAQRGDADADLWFERVHRASDTQRNAQDGARAISLVNQAQYAWLNGDPERAFQLCNEALAQPDAGDDVRASTFTVRAQIAAELGNRAGAIQDAEQAFSAFESLRSLAPGYRRVLVRFVEHATRWLVEAHRFDDAIGVLDKQLARVAADPDDPVFASSREPLHDLYVSVLIEAERHGDAADAAATLAELRGDPNAAMDARRMAVGLAAQAWQRTREPQALRQLLGHDRAFAAAVVDADRSVAEQSFRRIDDVLASWGELCLEPADLQLERACSLRMRMQALGETDARWIETCLLLLHLGTREAMWYREHRELYMARARRQSDLGNQRSAMQDADAAIAAGEDAYRISQAPGDAHALVRCLRARGTVATLRREVEIREHLASQHRARSYKRELSAALVALAGTVARTDLTAALVESQRAIDALESTVATSQDRESAAAFVAALDVHAELLRSLGRTPAAAEVARRAAEIHERFQV
jgi:tetratricopeptide (TPR) repeat protein